MKLSLYPSALGDQKQRLLDFNDLSSDLIYLSGLAAQEIGNDHPVKGLSSSHQQLSFLMQHSECLYGSFDILNKASNYEYQHA